MPSGFFQIAVKDIIRQTPEAVQIIFDIPAKLSPQFLYEAGQYITICKTLDNEEVRRSYSICSDPKTDLDLSVAVKEVHHGKMSTFLNQSLNRGDLLDIMPPMGNFQVAKNTEKNQHHFLFGGGSGITPLISMIKSILNIEGNLATLIYANKTEDSIIFKEELNTIKSKFPKRFKLIHTLDNPSSSWKGLQGQLNPDSVAELVDAYSFSSSVFYICGPNAMMEMVRDTLLNNAIHSEKIRMEYFTATSSSLLKENETEEVGNEVIESEATLEVYGEVSTVMVEEGQTILEAAQEADLDPPYSCSAGVCTTCRARIVSGNVVMEEREGLSDAEIEEGFVLTCQSKPTTKNCHLVFE